MKYWQPIVLYVAVLLGLYGTREVEAEASRKQFVAQLGGTYGTSGKQ